MHRDWIIRRVVQVASFFAVNNYFHKGIYQGPLKGYCFPGLNCHACPLARFACPIGALQYFIATHQFPYYILGFIVVVGLLGGRFICGFLCPFGFFQELLYKLSTYKIKLHKIFSYIKFLGLAVVVVVVYITNEPWFCKICPAGTLEAGIPQLVLDPPLRALVGWLFYMKCAILILVVILAILIKRPFCRILCPLGAILGLLNKLTQLQLNVDKERCNECDTCYRICPMDIRIYEDGRSFDCIRCFSCKSVCPRNAIRL